MSDYKAYWLMDFPLINSYVGEHQEIIMVYKYSTFQKSK